MELFAVARASPDRTPVAGQGLFLLVTIPSQSTRVAGVLVRWVCHSQALRSTDLHWVVPGERQSVVVVLR
jgi:hypothetical protein